jgi:hypothetical protein
VADVDEVAWAAIEGTKLELGRVVDAKEDGGSWVDDAEERVDAKEGAMEDGGSWVDDAEERVDAKEGAMEDGGARTDDEETVDRSPVSMDANTDGGSWGDDDEEIVVGMDADTKDGGAWTDVEEAGVDINPVVPGGARKGSGDGDHWGSCSLTGTSTSLGFFAWRPLGRGLGGDGGVRRRPRVCPRVFRAGVLPGDILAVKIRCSLSSTSLATKASMLMLLSPGCFILMWRAELQVSNVLLSTHQQTRAHWGSGNTQATKPQQRRG